MTPSQVKKYHRDGFIKCGPIFNTRQMARIRNDLEKRAPLLKGSKDVRVFNPHHHDSWFVRFAMRPEIVDLVEKLIGPNIAIFQTRVESKGPGGRLFFTWHQDAPYYPFEPNIGTTLWLAVDDATGANGAMLLIPGYQKSGLLNHVGQVIRDRRLKVNEPVTLDLKSGECSFHDFFTPHKSEGNRSDKRRCAFISRFIPTILRLIRNRDRYYGEDYRSLASGVFIFARMAFSSNFSR